MLEIYVGAGALPVVSPGGLGSSRTALHVWMIVYQPYLFYLFLFY